MPKGYAQTNSNWFLAANLNFDLHCDFQHYEGSDGEFAVISRVGELQGGKDSDVIVIAGLFWVF